jgi:transposase
LTILLKDVFQEDRLMANAWTLSDELVAKMTALVPARTNTHPRGGGRKPTPPDRILRAIFFVLRTGLQWKALDATALCSGSVAHRAFQQWAAMGIFRQMWALALAEYDDLKGLDWAWQSLDGAMNKAPLGGKKDGTKPCGSRETRRQAQRAHRGRGVACRLGA